MKLRASKQALEQNQTKNTIGVEVSQKEAEEALITLQRNEFMEYLTKKVDTSDFQFFHDMFKKLLDGVTLTSNMEDAIRRCMVKDAEYEAKKNQPAQPAKVEDLPKITLKMKQWWVKANNLDSRIISGVVLKESAKAYLVKGHADMVENCTWCARCGKELTEPASMIIGYGETCAKKVGVPYPSEILVAPKKERMKIRKQLLQVLHNQTFELWIPKSQIEEYLENGK